MGSLNLSEFIKNPYTKNAYFDFAEFGKAICVAVNALDNIIDENLNRHALKEQSENSRKYRNIGLGIMGYANALFKLGMIYGSQDAINFTSELFKILMYVALSTSCDLAESKGAFLKCKPNKIIQSEIVKKVATNELLKRIEQYGLRNCSLISIAPTGSIATMLGLTGGCEPEFALSYSRKTENLKESYDVYCKSVNEYWELTNDNIKKGNINDLPDYFITSKDIPWKQRIDTQATMQEYVDTAISSTINLPQDITIKEVEQIYLYAWQKGLKGVTIFRSGCNRMGILSTNTSSEKYEEVKLDRGMLVSVPDDLTYRKYKLSTGCGKLYLFVGIDDDGTIYDVFTNTDGVGGCTVNTQANSRLLSACIRGGIPMEYVIEQLQKSGTCPSFQYAKGKGKKLSTGKSCPSAIANILKQILEENKKQNEFEEDEDDNTYEPTHDTTVQNCPDCGESVRFEGGCVVCPSCGWSKCS